MANTTPTPTTPGPIDDLDADQKKGDYLTVGICSVLIIAIHIVSYIFWSAYPAFVLHEWWYYMVDAILITGYIVAAVIVWKMTFENYSNTKLGALIVATVLTLIFTLWVGRKAQDRVDNGFDVIPTTQITK